MIQKERRKRRRKKVSFESLLKSQRELLDKLEFTKRTNEEITIQEQIEQLIWEREQENHSINENNNDDFSLKSEEFNALPSVKNGIFDLLSSLKNEVFDPLPLNAGASVISLMGRSLGIGDDEYMLPTKEDEANNGISLELKTISCNNTEDGDSSSDDDYGVFMEDVVENDRKEVDGYIMQPPSYPILGIEQTRGRIVSFKSSMRKSFRSQHKIHEWDRKMGLKRSHSKTMRQSMKSREILCNFMGSGFVCISQFR